MSVEKLPRTATIMTGADYWYTLLEVNEKTAIDVQPEYNRAGKIVFLTLQYLKFRPSFSPRGVCIKRLFRVVISPLSCSLSFGIFQGAEAENKGEVDGRLPSQF